MQIRLLKHKCEVNFILKYFINILQGQEYISPFKTLKGSMSKRYVL